MSFSSRKWDVPQTLKINSFSEDETFAVLLSIGSLIVSALYVFSSLGLMSSAVDCRLFPILLVGLDLSCIHLAISFKSSLFFLSFLPETAHRLFSNLVTVTTACSTVVTDDDDSLGS